MEWKQAKNLLKKRKKIRRDSWSKRSYLHSIDPIMHSAGGKAIFSVKQFEAGNWEEHKDEDLEKIPIKDRTQSQHQQLVKKYGGIREYLLSMGAFKDVPMKEKGEWNLFINAEFKEYDDCPLEKRSFNGEVIKKLKTIILEDNKNNIEITGILHSLQDEKISIRQTLDAIEEVNKKIIERRFGF